MVEVLALALHRLVRFSQQSHGFTAAAAFLPSRHLTLRCFQAMLSLQVAAWIMNHRAFGQGGKGFQSDINARFLACEGQRFYWNLSARDADIPPIDFT